MLICYSRPTDVTWTIASNGTGQAWVSDDDGDNLTNNRPGLGSVFSWSTSAQTTSSYVELRAAWTSPTTVGAVALLGVGLPVGTSVEVYGRAAGGSVWDVYMGDAEVHQRARGERVVIFDTRATTQTLDGLALRFYNDVGGSADIPTGYAVSLGEVMFGPAHSESIAPEFEEELTDTTQSEYSTTGQQWSAVGVTYRTLRTQPAVRKRDAMFQGTTPANDYYRLLSQLDRSKPILIVPDDYTGRALQDAALYGVVTELGGYRHLVGGYYTPARMTIRELPVPV